MHLAVASLSGARAGNGLMVLVRVVYTRIGIAKDQLQSHARLSAFANPRIENDPLPDMPGS